MKLIVSLIVIGICLVVETQAENYCDRKLCQNGKHIGCNNSGAFAKSCPKDRKLVQMTPDLKAAIVKKHNQLRNTLASGKLKGFQSASRMATMKWDDELAKLAELNVKTCKFAHDACRNTERYPQSGQNLAESSSSADVSAAAPQSKMLPLIDSWWSEHRDASMQVMNSYPRSTRATIGHFTVMSVDSNVAVGCASATFRKNNWYTFLMACNYAKTNMISQKIYESGKTASKCKTGTNPEFPGLCSLRENY